MKLNIIETKVKIISKSGERIHDNHLANASVTFYLDDGDHLTISGFSIWRSKFEDAGINITPPGSKTYKYLLTSDHLWTKLTKEIKEQYDRESIPVVNGTSSDFSWPGTKSNNY